MVDPHEKGLVGEWLIARALQASNAPGYGRALHSVYMPLYDTLTEIDLLAIHQTGIYIIESKNLSGDISANCNDKYWRCTPPHSQPYNFYSPVFQNNTHLKTFKYHSKLSHHALLSYIIFGDGAKLHIAGYHNPNRAVACGNSDIPRIMNLRDFNNIFLRDISSRRIIFSPAQVDYIADCLYPNTVLVSAAQKAEHVAKIKANFGKLAHYK